MKDLPGRLGNMDLTINEDKRINKDLLKAMISFVGCTPNSSSFINR